MALVLALVFGADRMFKPLIVALIRSPMLNAKTVLLTKQTANARAMMNFFCSEFTLALMNLSHKKSNLKLFI
jgi:hypothetical protein